MPATDKDIGQIREQLRQLIEAVTKIDRATVLIQATCPGCKAELERLDEEVQGIDTAIRGNGDAGLRAEVALLRTNLDDIRRSLNWQLAASVSMLVGIVGIVATHILT